MSNYNKKLFDAVNAENKILDNEITRLKELYSTDDQKVYYQAQQTQYLAYYNAILLVIYYLLAVTAMYPLFFKSSTDESTTNPYSFRFILKIIFAAFLLTYPYIIKYIVFYATVIYDMASSLIQGNVYTIP